MKPFERSCLYHEIEGMRVIEADQENEYKRLLETNEWFDHPLKVKKRVNHEKQIRRNKKQRCSNGEQSSEKI